MAGESEMSRWSTRGGLLARFAPRRDNPPSAAASLREPLDDDAGVQLNLPNLRAGSIDVAYFSVDVTRPWGNHLLYAVDALGWFRAEVQAHSDAIAITVSADEIEAAHRSGKAAAVLAVENSEVLERSLYVLPQLHRLGVRSITLTWSYRTEAADGVLEAATGGDHERTWDAGGHLAPQRGRFLGRH